MQEQQRALNLWRTRLMRGFFSAGALGITAIPLGVVLRMGIYGEEPIVLVFLLPLVVMVYAVIHVLRNYFPSPVVLLADGISFAERADAPDVTWAQLREVHSVQPGSVGTHLLEFQADNLHAPVNCFLTTPDYYKIESAWLASNPSGKPAKFR